MARKASLSLMLGWFVVAIAGLAVAGFGFGIAQAGGNHTTGEFMEWQTLEQGSSSSPTVENRPVLSFADDMQLRNNMQSGSLPVESNADSSIGETEEDMYRVWEHD